MDILSVKNLSKRFGTHQVIDTISFSVPEGSIFGFLGANGQGKTTTMKMILGLLPADEGEILVCGEKVAFGATATNRHIGYLPDVPEFYGYMRPMEYLKLCGEIVGLRGEETKKRSKELLEMVGLGGINKKINGFSRGMKQRLGMAQALLNEPKLLICDEPTSALDPMGRKEILDILEKIKGKTTVIFSTHILSDVERVCDRLAVINGGSIVLAGTFEEIKSQKQVESIQIDFGSTADKDRFISLAGNLMDVSKIGEQSVCLNVSDIKAAQKKILQILAAHEILPVKLEVLEPSLESLFLEVVS